MWQRSWGGTDGQGGKAADRGRGARRPPPQALHRAGAGAGRAGGDLLRADHRQDGPGRVQPGALMTDTSLPAHTARNLRVGAICAAIVLAMVGAAYAAVPIYQLFCQLTGFGGTTQVSAGNPKGVIDRVMTVRFDSNVGADLAWKVTPAAPITDKIGTV